MKRVLGAALFTVVLAVTCSAQQPAAPAGAAASPVAKQPQPKSQPELQALQQIFAATDPDARMKGADEFVTKFADSEFKAVALMVAAESARQKNDHEKAILYAERSLEIDPGSYMAMIILSSELAAVTREHDLDKEEKLKRSEKYAQAALEALKTAARPRSDVTDEQWALAKKDFESQAHVALGMGALVRKNCEVASSEFKLAVEVPNPDPAAQIRYGMALTQCNKPDEAIAQFDKVLALTDVPPVFKQYAQQEKAKAVQKKGGAAPAAAPAAAQPKP